MWQDALNKKTNIYNIIIKLVRSTYTFSFLLWLLGALPVNSLLTEGLAIMLYVAIISYTYIVLSNLEVKGVLKNDSL